MRKTLAFSKEVEACKAAAAWEDGYYNLVRPHKSLRSPVSDAPPKKWLLRTPAIAAKLTDHIWTVKELLTTLPSHVATTPDREAARSEPFWLAWLNLTQ